jgi:hypothetical protein
MPIDPLRLDALTRTAIRAATAAYVDGGTLKAWEAAMRSTLARGHTAAYLAGLAERLGVPVNSALVSERRLSKVERSEIKTVVAAQLKYLDGFVKDIDAKKLSAAQIAARAELYAGATRPTYYASRWGDWVIPDRLMPGRQICQTNCRCSVSVKDTGEGRGVLTRVMGKSEQSCGECPGLAGEHAVKRRMA